MIIDETFQMKGSARKSLVYDLLLQDHNHEHEKTVEEVAMSAFIGGFPLHFCSTTS